MSTFRLFPATNGPASPVSYTGNFIAGVVFSVAGGGNWFEGYWWWVSASGQSTAAVTCALWSVGGGTTGESQVITGSVITSGTLTAGQWNYIPLPQPLQLAPGWSADDNSNETSCYIAAIGVNGNFPDTSNFWTSPIDNGPLHAYQGGNPTGAANPPFSLPQGVFTVAGTDPSVTMPNSTSGTDNFWVDVQISDQTPAGYAGSYRLWPNKADANPTVTGDDNVNYTIATEIHLTQSCTLNNIWYFSPIAATTLATRCDVWDISSGLSIASIATPAWLDAFGAAYTAGSAPAGTLGSWTKAGFPGGITLGPGQYRVSVFNANGTSDFNWSAKDASSDYWGQTVSGVGGSGITWGPLYAPNWANASSGYVYGGNGTDTPPFSSGGTTVAHAQPVFGMNNSGTIQFPQLYAVVNIDQTQNYWVDLEVTPTVPGTSPGLLMAGIV